MQLPVIRYASTSINIAGRYISVDGRCDCGEIATTVACFTIRNNEPTAILLCQPCADDFAEVEAGNDYLLVAINEIIDMAKERKAKNAQRRSGRPSRMIASQEQILDWIAAQPEPVRAWQLSEMFGATRSHFCTLMIRWAERGLVERVAMPNLYRAARPGVGYRVATAR